MLRCSEIANWLYCAAALALFVASLSPHLLFKNDIDPSDGDVLNSVQRLLGGWAIFGDWTKGEIYGNYTPLYYFYLCLAEIAGIDIVIFGRISNVIFIVVSFIIAAMTVAQVLKDSLCAQFCAAFTIYLLLLRKDSFSWAAMLRTDPLLLVLELTTLRLLCLQPQKVKSAALLAALAPFVKQTGLVLPLSIFLYYFWFNRTALIKYSVYALSLAALLTLAFEMHNHGNFLRAAFYAPWLAFGVQAQWKHFNQIFLSFHPNYASLGIAALAIIGAQHIIRRKLPATVLLFVFVVDLLVFLRTGHHTGGGGSYLWLHWILISVFAGVGTGAAAEFLISGGAKKLADPWNSLRRGLILSRLPAAPSAGRFLLSLFCLAATLLMMSRLEPVRTLQQAARERIHFHELALVAAKHQQLIVQLTKRAPEKKWYCERLSMAAVRAGNILDHDACTIRDALKTPKVIDQSLLQKAFASGEYHFIQRSGIAPIAVVEEAIDKFYGLIARSDTVYAGVITTVEIYEYGRRTPLRQVHPTLDH